jgi:hypothetical protein
VGDPRRSDCSLRIGPPTNGQYDPQVRLVWRGVQPRLAVSRRLFYLREAVMLSSAGTPVDVRGKRIQHDNSATMTA